MNNPTRLGLTNLIAYNKLVMITLTLMDHHPHHCTPPPHTSQIPRRLHITLNHRSFYLPFTNVGTKSHPVLIPYFDPRRRLLARAAAHQLADLVINYAPQLILTPTSSKSLPMVKATLNYAAKFMKFSPQLLILDRFPQKQFSVQPTKYALTHRYQTITLPHDKVMCLTPAQAQILRQSINRSTIIIDDVISTGGTLGAIRSLYKHATQTSHPIPALAVIQEFPVALHHLSTWHPQPEPHNYPLLITPVLDN